MSKFLPHPIGVSIPELQGVLKGLRGTRFRKVERPQRGSLRSFAEVNLLQYANVDRF